MRHERQIAYFNLILDKSPIEKPNQKCEEILAEQVAKYWPKPFASIDALDNYSHRRTFYYDEILPDFAGEDFELFLAALCEGKRTFAQVASQSLSDVLLNEIGFQAWQRLEQAVPRQVTLASGKQVSVKFGDDTQPYIESYLQDFFGTKKTPTWGKTGKTLVVHLWGPNRRTLQITSDLGHFWAKTYPSLVREYARRYPKHHWPVEPLTAQPVLLKRHLGT